VAFTSNIASGKSLVKPRARPQAELDTTTHGQEWEMEEEEDNDVDYATTSAEDVSFSSEFTEEEANDGDVGGVVDEDEIELAPRGKALEEKDVPQLIIQPHHIYRHQ